MVKPRILKRTCGGTRVRDRLFATGCFVENGSRALTNFKGICVRIQAKKDSLVQFVQNVLCEATTYRSTSKLTVEVKRVVRTKLAKTARD